MKKQKIVTTISIQEYDNNPDYSKQSNRFKYQNIAGLLNNSFLFVRTKEEDMIYNECVKSPLYFIENILGVKLYGYQIVALEKIHNNGKTYILHSRQVGITKLLEWYILWRLCFTNDVIGIHKGYDKNKIDNINKLYRVIPYYLKPNIITFNSSVMQTSKSMLVYINRARTFDFIVCDGSYDTNCLVQLNTGGKIVAAYGLYTYNGIIEFLKALMSEVINQTNNYLIIKKDDHSVINIIGDGYKYEYGLDIIDFLLNFKLKR